ncbi:RNA methyltransferase, TrmH family [Clostridium pasteurianum DSM 525 = ATCC 6013]|uniref:RNA methyltransferase, TrmH family n=1 Tax=Clostridium pasteurianum DSM 525 = ATCC 6013 TaxID=1262449 RepID=A0A0H3J2R9_CLOPA|nr:RNA methyltransferase, TrmH family [Clostridium pasteurianum DSM 525 = ATCC 6013]AOZ78842.1 RNA methyltransferase [Clostridium pasteurianum]AJA51737.1 RNA methyltransferase, TrmH family [Clostridium pasteurianum DSM 525 = ATCC 6013]AOZ75047.1 RNA methyltransferase [Clostridium pasteurianum DSM 525 = ATCC 6013]ELP59652.1 RNA methyltransferase [Clostridium pasteurianum DSM 525 = ATCC 6013]
MEIIKSKDNTIIKDIKKLQEKKYRNIYNRFIVEGFRFVSEALESNFNVIYVIISESIEEKFEKIGLNQKIKGSTKIIKVSESILKSICSTDNPQGIAAVVSNREINVDYDEGFYILADRVQDPGNMGTIIRTANAAGAKGIIVTKGSVDIYNSKTLRSTMGSIFKIPIIIDEDLVHIKEFKEQGFKIVVSSLDTKNNFYDIDLTGKIIIAVGNEGSGISEEIYGISDVRVKIPMPGNTESLNVGIAAGIMMFEAVRQKNS